MLTLVGLGFGDIIGSILIGYVADNYNSKQTTIICAVLTTLSIVISMSYIYFFEFSFIYALLMCFSWGLQNSATNVHLVCILGFEFDSKTTPFSVKEFYSGIFVFGLICAESLIR